MRRRSFFRLAGATALTAAVPNVFAGNTTKKITDKKNLTNPFETGGKWYKAALHVHTTNSDGDVDLPTRIKQYRDLDYDIVAITDHRTTNDLSPYTDKGFLALSSTKGPGYPVR